MKAILPEAPPPEATAASISLANLQHALKVVGGAIERTATIPILTGTRMQQLPDGLALESTNLDVYIRAIVQELAGPEQAVVIPAEKFVAWTKLLSGERVAMKITERNVNLSCGRSRATLPVMPAANWPAAEVYAMKSDGITLTQGVLARSLKFAMLAVSEEESRYTLNGIQASGDGTHLKLVATDGHTMMVYTLACTEKIDLLLPARFIKALLPLLTDEDGGIDLTWNDKLIRADIDADLRIHAGATQIAGKFPNWQTVFPHDERTVVTVKVEDLRPALERCMLLSDERSGALRLTFGEQFTIRGANAMEGEATETVECEGQPKEELTIGLNGDYLLRLVKKFSGTLTIKLPDSNQKPLLFCAEPHPGETIDYVVMPLRV